MKERSLGALVELLRGDPEHTVALILNLARPVIIADRKPAKQTVKSPRDRTRVCSNNRKSRHTSLNPS